MATRSRPLRTGLTAIVFCVILAAFTAACHRNQKYPKMTVPTLTLYNGKQMPLVGLGTYLGWQHDPKDKDLLVPAIEEAIDLGYRHFDTASIYETEETVGLAIRNKISSGIIKREELFVTTKLWNDQHSPEKVEKALLASLKKLELEYVDLYLMHWPMAYLKDFVTEELVDYVDTWRAMEQALEKGLTRSIGVSNFNIAQLQRLIANSTLKPAVLQIEAHLSLTQKPLVKFAQDNGIAVTAYCPLGFLPSSRAMDDKPAPKLNDPVLTGIADKYNKTVTQIALKYLVERGMAVIPKSLKGIHLASNIALFDFSLSSDEIKHLGSFNSSRRLTLPDFWQDHPDYPFERSEKHTSKNVFFSDSQIV